jgi:hypothetical protein
MSVLGNISLSGLTITNSDYILAANLEVTTSLTVDNGASIALPNHSIADTALSTNVMLLDTAQDSTAPKTFITTVPDVAPVQVQYYADESVIGAIQLYPQLSSGDALIVGSVDNANGFQIQGSNGYNYIRFSQNQINVTADAQLNLTAGLDNAVEITDASFNITGRQFISGWSSATEYENYFVGDIWTEKGLTTRNGLFIQDDIVPGSTTYASINNLGQAELDTISSKAITASTPTINNKTLQLVSTAISPNPTISFSPYTSGGGYNPIVQAGDGVMMSDNCTGLCMLLHGTAISGFRTDSTTSKMYGKTGFQLYVSDYNPTTAALEASSTTITVRLPLLAPTSATNTNDTRVATSAYCNAFHPQLATANTFLGRQTFTQTGNLTYPILWRSNNATATTRQGYLGITTTSTNFNPICVANDCVVLGADTTTVDSGVLTLSTHSNTACGIRITNNTVSMTGTTIQTTGTLQANNALTVTGTATTNGTLINNGAVTNNSTLTVTGTTTTNGSTIHNGAVTLNNSLTGSSTSYATTSAHIGFVDTITSFTTPSGTGTNVLGTYVFDNASNYKYGTYQIISNIRCTSTVSQTLIQVAWDTQNTTMGGLYSDIERTLPVANVLRVIATVKIYSTQTWYLLFQCDTTSYTFDSAKSSLDIIRIA